MARRGEAYHNFEPRKTTRQWKDHHEFKMGPWVRCGRRRYELRLWRFDIRHNKIVNKLFALVLDEQGTWHMWTVDESEWTSLATPGLLTAKVRFYQQLYAAGWRATEKEIRDAISYTRGKKADEQVSDRAGSECKGLAFSEPAEDRGREEAAPVGDPVDPGSEGAGAVSNTGGRLFGREIGAFAVRRLVGQTPCGADAQDFRGKATVRRYAENKGKGKILGS